MEVAFFWVHNLAFDLISVSPFESTFEPRGNQLRLQRFLRTCRVPFLVLLLAPAMLPGFFVQVPRAAPTGGPGVSNPRACDVSRIAQYPTGYLLGVLAWVLGIAAGVAAIKSLISASQWFHRRLWKAHAPPAQGEDVADQPPLANIDDRCPLRHAGCATGGCPRGQPALGKQPKTECRARRQSLYSIAVFIGIFFATYVAMARIPYLYRVAISPAFAVCATLGILAMAVAMLEFLPRWVALRLPEVGHRPRLVQLPMVLLLVGWLAFANNSPYKYRFECMLYDNAKLVDLRERTDKVYFPETAKPAEAGLVSDEKALEAWGREVREGDHDLDAGGLPKLVVVAVSGGAARSAYWTAVVLDRLERNLPPEFGRRVRIISGASGGMLGTACYVKYRRDALADPSILPAPGSGIGPSAWVQNVPLHSMEPLAKHIALSEIWRSLWPGYQGDDRGIVLERDWVDLRFPLRELAGDEQEGKIPSLIFSPMMVEDGRRLLISNLNLCPDPGRRRSDTCIAKARGRRISRSPASGDPAETGAEPEDYSLSGMEFFRIFPESQCLLVSTAVRMNASFPYVSPAVSLPTTPPRRVVDAGYYDNYGVQVAVAWVRQHRDWLAKNTSGVLLVQVRDSASERERLDVDDATPSLMSWGNVSRGFQFLTSPIDGFQEARYTSSSFRNDDDVESLAAMFSEHMSGKVTDPESFFATAIFENSAAVTLDDTNFWSALDDLTKDTATEGADNLSKVTMNWNLTRAEQQATPAGNPRPSPGQGQGQEQAVRICGRRASRVRAGVARRPGLRDPLTLGVGDSGQGVGDVGEGVERQVDR